MGSPSARTPRLPPPWFMHAFWRVHRALVRLSGGRLLWRPGGKLGWGALRLTTTGRRSGRPRDVVVGYLEDGERVSVLAMNGFEEGHPAWWLNLEAHPEAVVRLPHRAPRTVRAHRAVGEEHDRLWRRWTAVDEGLDELADRRATETPIIVFEPVVG